MATPLDAFFVTLGLDPKLFQEGVRVALEDLVRLKKGAEDTAQDMQASGEKASDFYKSLLTNATKLFALFTAGKGFKDFISDTIKAKAEMYEFASSLQIDIEKVQTWGRAVKNEGGTAEGFQSSLQGMVEKLSVVGTKMRGAKMAEMALQMAGLTKEAVKGKDAFEVYGLMAEKFKKLSDAGDPGKAFKLGKMLGMDTGTIRLLMKGGEEVENLIAAQKKLGTYTLEDAKAADDLDDSWTDTQTALKKAVGFIAKEALPILSGVNELLKGFAAWAREHPGVMKAAFAGIGTAILVFGAAALKASIMMLPFSLSLTLITLAIAGVVAGITWLVLQFKKWRDGAQDTNKVLVALFTFFLDAWNRVKAVVGTIMAAIWAIIKDYVKVIMDQFELIAALLSGDSERIGKAWDTLCKDMAILFKRAAWLVIYEGTLMYIAISRYIDSLDAKYSNLLGKLAKKLVFGGAENYKKWGEGVEDVKQFWSGVGAKAGGYLGMQNVASMSPVGLAGAGFSRTSEMIIHAIHINAPNATNADQIAAEIPGAIQKNQPQVDMAEGW